MKPRQSRKFRLAAIDLDGTLLGPDLTISRANLEALERLRDAGMEVVLASGRHHESMRPHAERVAGVEWLVSSQGAEVSDLPRRRTVHAVYLEPATAQEAFEIGHRLGHGNIVYTADGVFAPADGHARWVDFYAQLSGHAPMREPLSDLFRRNIYKVLWLGDEAHLGTSSAHAELEPLNAYKVRTHRHVFEFLSARASKGVGVAALAAHLGVGPEAVVAFGDGDNDVPLFEWAGTSVAMPHGWPEAKRRASAVAPEGPPETALARAVELVLG
ncbi:MAG TPA: Cof-type HAD-IIB family hydrolase [Opitutaceae bacterium]